MVGMDLFMLERARALHGRGAEVDLAVRLACGLVTPEELRSREATIVDLLERVERGEIDPHSTFWHEGAWRPRFPVGEWERQLREVRQALAAAEAVGVGTVIA